MSRVRPKNIATSRHEGLSRRAERALERLGLTELEDACRYFERELLALPGVGHATVAEIRSALRRRGLALRDIDVDANALVLLNGVDDLLLDVRSRRVLEALGLATVAELTLLSPRYVRRQRGCGAGTVEAIRSALRRRGLDLHPRGYGFLPGERGLGARSRRRALPRLLDETYSLDDEYRVILGLHGRRSARALAAWVGSGRPGLNATRRHEVQRLVKARTCHASPAAKAVLRALGAVEQESYVAILRERRLLRAEWPADMVVRFLRLVAPGGFTVQRGSRGSYVVARGYASLAHTLDRLR